VDLILKRAVLSKLNGGASAKVNVEFIDGKDKTVTLALDRIAPKGTMARFGFLPPMPVWIDSRKLPGEVEYIRFNQFFEPTVLMSRFEDAVRSCLTCKGMIIDLRGNTGGIGAMAMGMAGWFIEKPNQKLGTMIMRDTTMKFVINPRPETFAGRLAILTDGTSASTSEILAGGLQDLKRARVFGTRSAAAALPSVIIKLPNGDAFQYAQANYVSEGGKPLEGLGVTPDVEVRPTRQALLEGHDLPLEAAVDWITHHD
jgi:carboxyl-terminal processing protease